MKSERICLKTSAIHREPQTYNRSLEPYDQGTEFRGFGPSGTIISGSNILPDHGTAGVATATQRFESSEKLGEKCCHAHAKVEIKGNAMDELVHLRRCDLGEYKDFSRKMQ